MGTKLAKEFTKFCLDENHIRPEKFMSRNVRHADNPKPLNYHLMDKDCAVLLKRMYGGEDGSTKQDNGVRRFSHQFFGSEENVKDLLEAVDDYSREMLD